MSFKKLMLLSCSALLLSTAPVFAKSKGTESGGGGDATELRVNEIRSDILKWINEGGAKGLKLPESLSYNSYVSKMTKILELNKVVIGFVEADDLYNDELKVAVNGVPKTCRGFISEIDFRPHILCNISRFRKTSDSDQYKLIHHEYAGLVNVENNKGAASDYVLSSQITDFLVPQTVLKLAVKKSTQSLNGKWISPLVDILTNTTVHVLNITISNDGKEIIMKDEKGAVDSYECKAIKKLVTAEFTKAFFCNSLSEGGLYVRFSERKGNKLTMQLSEDDGNAFSIRDEDLFELQLTLKK